MNTTYTPIVNKPPECTHFIDTSIDKRPKQMRPPSAKIMGERKTAWWFYMFMMSYPIPERSCCSFSKSRYHEPVITCTRVPKRALKLNHPGLRENSFCRVVTQYWHIRSEPRKHDWLYHSQSSFSISGSQLGLITE